MTDERLKKTEDIVRKGRPASDRNVTENRELSDDDRVEMFRQQFFQSALPDLPNIDGWHTCWLTTTNPRDSIHMRMRLGYEPIKPEDIPGWEYVTLKTGEYAGMIGVNEMVAFKIPMSLYQRFMQEAHHDAPMREEGKLTDTAEFLQQQARSNGSDVMVGDGISALKDKRIAKFDLSH